MAGNKSPQNVVAIFTRAVASRLEVQKNNKLTRAVRNVGISTKPL
jgi:hypothetical protein